jgi:hypothetical protein
MGWSARTAQAGRVARKNIAGLDTPGRVVYNCTMTEPTTAPTFKVPAENIASLQERFEKLNKRIARDVKRGVVGAEPLVLEVGPLFAEKNKKGDHLPDRVFAMVTLIAPKPPKADGWEFVAALTHVEGVGTVLRVVPGANVEEGELAKYREASPDNCDHCHASRQRKDTFILRKVVA